MDHSPLNGRPVLLDQHGRPMRKPDGDGRPAGIALPHGWTFISRYSGASYTYWHHFFDEALRHAREDAEAMRRDSYLMSLVQERQMAVTGLNWHLEVPDEKDRHQMRVKDGLTKLIKGIPFLRRMLVWWSEALWYGKYAVQVEYAWTTFTEEVTAARPQAPPAPPGMPPGQPPAPPAGDAKEKPRRARRRGLTVASAWPVNGDKIGHQYDHTPYVLVNGAMAADLPNAEIITTPLGMALSLRGSWRERFLIHKHMQEDRDYFASDQAEAVHGVGIRSLAFWNYFLRMQWLSNITDFFDRVGLGLTLWKYPQGDPVARAAAEKAALEQQSRANLLVPVPEGLSGKGQGAVERIEVPTSGADALGQLVEMIDRYLERYIVGQEGSSKGSSSGLGNEASAEFQKDTKTKIAMQDAAFLAETISGSEREPGLVNTLQRYTYSWADFPVSFIFDVERGESEKKLAAAKSLVDMGLKVKADEVRAAGGFSKPADGDELVQPPTPPGMPGGGGENPLAALLGGGGNGPPGGGPGGGGSGEPPPPGGGPPAPAGPAGGGGAGEGGDLLQALRASRRGAAVRYRRLRRLVDALQEAGQTDLARAVVREYRARTGGRR